MFVAKINTSFLDRFFRPTRLVVHLNSYDVNPKTNTEFQMSKLMQYFKKHVKIDYPDDWQTSKYLLAICYLLLLLLLFSEFPFYFFISVMLFFIIGGFIANFVRFK